MVSQVSFGSTYKVRYNSGEDMAPFEKFQRIRVPEGGYSTLKDRLSGSKYFAESTLIVPDSEDTNVEDYCKMYGIKFTKKTTADLLNPKNIEKRIAPPKNGYYLVNLDVEKFGQIKKDEKMSNIEHCEDDYNKYYNKRIDYMLRKGDEVPATTLFIDTNIGGDFDRYVSRYGTNGVCAHLNFDQRTSNPDHCMFFALRDLGMKKVPVYVNEKSYNIGKTLGLF